MKHIIVYGTLAAAFIAALLNQLILSGIIVFVATMIATAIGEARA